MEENALYDIVEGIKYALVFINILLFIILYISIDFRDASESTVNSKPQARALIVIAHPDDECMFFTPLLHLLTAPKSKYHFPFSNPSFDLSSAWEISILCLSQGNAYNLAHIRVKELESVAKALNASVSIVNDSQLLDGMDTHWDISLIADHVLKHIQSQAYDAIFTFDSNGVSEHPNHIAVHYGVKEAQRRYSEQGHTIRMYSLESTNILRKYIGIFDLPLSLTLGNAFTIILFRPNYNYQLMKLHESQFIWYRRMFVIFSRYTFINTFQEIQVPSTCRAKEE